MWYRVKILAAFVLMTCSFQQAHATNMAGTLEPQEKIRLFVNPTDDFQQITISNIQKSIFLEPDPLLNEIIFGIQNKGDAPSPFSFSSDSKTISLSGNPNIQLHIEIPSSLFHKIDFKVDNPRLQFVTLDVCPLKHPAAAQNKGAAKPFGEADVLNLD